MRCTGSKLDGSPCRTSFGLNEAGLCAQHDPARQGTMRAGVERSLEVRAEKRALQRAIFPDGIPEGPPRTLNDATRWSAFACHAVATGVIDARTSEAITKSVTVFLAAMKAKELEAETRQLRDQLEAIEKRTKLARAS